MSSINSVNFVFGQYYDSTNLNQNGYSLTTTTNVPDETILDIELNGVIYNSFIRNNASTFGFWGSLVLLITGLQMWSKESKESEDTPDTEG